MVGVQGHQVGRVADVYATAGEFALALLPTAFGVVFGFADLFDPFALGLVGFAHGRIGAGGVFFGFDHDFVTRLFAVLCPQLIACVNGNFHQALLEIRHELQLPCLGAVFGDGAGF